MLKHQKFIKVKQGANSGSEGNKKGSEKGEPSWAAVVKAFRKSSLRPMEYIWIYAIKSTNKILFHG